MTQEVRDAIKEGTLTADFSMSDVIGHIVMWIILTIITFGIAAVFWPYSAAKLIINSLSLKDFSGNKIANIKTNLDIGQQLGPIVLWALIIIVTMGLAYPFYVFGVARKAFDNTAVA